MRVEVGHRFEVPLREGYDYITDLQKWPEFWPGLVRVGPESRWSAPGDQAVVVLRVLGRRVELAMTLLRIEPYRLIEYRTVQRGGLGPAEALHERHFADEGGSFGFRIVVELEPRGGLRGFFDRLFVRRAVERIATQTIANLKRQLGEGAPG